MKPNDIDSSSSVSSEIEINAPTSNVWDVVTNSKYAKILGNEFDKNAFIESDWKLGSKVHFKYEPDRLITSGTITKLTDAEYIQIDYSGMTYTERLTFRGENGSSVLQIFAGPYTEDYEAQKVVWNNWLNKVKELCEMD